MKIKKSILRCVNCHNNMQLSDDINHFENKIICNECKNEFQILDNKYIFASEVIDKDIKNWESVNKDFNPYRKNENEKFMHPNIVHGPLMKDLRSIYVSDLTDSVCVNLGSGQDIFEGYINVDYGNYKNVDIVADIQNLPFQNNSIDFIISNSVLEHIENPEKVVSEIKRVLKPGGKAYISVPQVSVRHHEIDYFRWTLPGLQKLFKDFDLIESDYCRNPGYSIHSILQILRFNNQFNFVQGLKLKISEYLLKFLYNFQYEKNEYNQAASNTIYIVVKQKTRNL